MVEGDKTTMLKYAAIGVGAIVLGATVWFLSKETSSELDYKIYTKEKL